jgi:hypothetical protein
MKSACRRVQASVSRGRSYAVKRRGIAPPCRGEAEIGDLQALVTGRPFVFSLLPRCHGEWASQKTCWPVAPGICWSWASSFAPIRRPDRAAICRLRDQTTFPSDGLAPDPLPRRGAHRSSASRPAVPYSATRQASRRCAGDRCERYDDEHPALTARTIGSRPAKS